MALIDQTTIYPTELDIAENVGDGNIQLEANIQELNYYQFPRNHVCGNTDLELENPTGGSPPTIDVTGGTAYINGYRVTLTEDSGKADTLSLSSGDGTYYIYLQLQRDANNRVDGVAFTMNTDGSVPTESVKIGEVEVSGTSIDEWRDMRPSAFVLPANFELYPIQTTSGTTQYGKKVHAYVPFFGQKTTFRCRVNIGTDQLGNSFAVCRLRATGPLGTQESSQFSSGTFVGTIVSEQAVVVKVEMDMDFEIDLATTGVFNQDSNNASYSGGHIYLELGAYRSSGSGTIYVGQNGVLGTPRIIELAAAGTDATGPAEEHDVRGMNRWLDWNAPG